MVYVLEIDYEKCTGCQCCTIACALKRERISNPRLGRIQPARWEEEGVHIPIVCRQCEDAPCQRVCPVDALPRDPVTQVVNVDYDRCIGCRMCVIACPFGAMVVDPLANKILKCDHCDGDPMCVKVCRNEAVKYVPLTQSLYAKRMTGSQKLQELMETTT